MRLPLPDSLVAQARAYADGSAEPVTPRNAATVVLLRASADPSMGPDVYLLRRQTSMAFAAGMCVFPGGGVDDRDFDASVVWAGPSPVEWADRLGVDDEHLARALVCAAVRETFEESGVLLAGTSDADVVADVTGDDWEADRHALESRQLAFTEFLERRGLVLRSDQLGAWAGWLTPVFEPRRSRTWFFVAVLPEGQRTRDVSTESDHVTWLPAMAAAEAVEREELFMLPPTYFTCLDVGRAGTPDAVLAAARERTVEMFMPEVVADGDDFVLSMPPGAEALLAGRGR